MYIATLRLILITFMLFKTSLGFSSDERRSSKRSLASFLEAQECYEDESETSDDEEIIELKQTKKRIKISNEVLESHIKSAELRIKMLRKEQELEKYILTKKTYKTKPYTKRTKTLTISDRKILLEGPIDRVTTENVIRKINFYNSKHASHPIFLFITSPGGSVIQGFKLLDTINRSQAPVYVVVKEFVASMAAVITAQAQHSYALENAIILHHEPSTFSYGNTSNLREGVQFLEEIEQRLMTPLLEKLGYENIESWREDLYKHSVTGDWTEFAGNAIKLKWVNNLVKEIRDHSSVSLQDMSEIEEQSEKNKEDTNSSETSTTSSTPLNPFDFNYMYKKRV